MSLRLILIIIIIFFTLLDQSYEISNNNKNNNNKKFNGKKPKTKISIGNCICGKKPSNKQKIVGGVTSNEHVHPWITALIYVGGSKPAQFCGSSLINDQYVLTAAHCVEKMRNFQDYRVYMGSNKINGTDVKQYGISQVISHQKYDSKTLDYDIALIKLSQTVQMTKNIKPICLSKTGNAFAGRKSNIAGWGTQSKNGNGVNSLRETWVKVIENEECSKSYSSTNIKITANMLCAALPGKDSCSGDSGGPMTLPMGEQFRQIGIVSFGIDCGSPKYPGVYTRVSRFIKWIQENTKDSKYCSQSF